MPSSVVATNRKYPGPQYSNGWGYVTPNPESWAHTDTENKRRSRVWSRTPNFKQVKSGLLLTLPYTDDQWEKTLTPFTASFPTLNNGCQVTNVIAAANLFTPNLADTADCLSRAISNAASKVGNYTVNLGITGAESKKTFNMFNNAVKSLATAARQVRRGHFGKAAQTLGLKKVPPGVSQKRSFSNNWLEYRYGWRTLVMDVDGAVKHLAQTIVAHPPLFVVKASCRDVAQWSDTAMQGSKNALPYPGINVQTLNKRSNTYLLGASITYKFTAENSLGSNANQLGLVNPALVAWELIPYSFVVDWFVNIGDVLQNMTSFYGKTLLDGSQTRYASLTVRTKVLEVWSDGTKGASVDATNVATRRLFERTKIGWLSVVPRFHVNLSTNRLVDAGALLRQRFLR